MQTATRRRTTWAIGASALAHVAVLAVALLEHPTLPPQTLEAGPPQAVIPVLILPRAALSAAGGEVRPGEVRLHRRPQRADENLSPAKPPPVAPLPAALLPVAPSPAKAAEAGKPPALAAEGQPTAPGAPGPDLRAALRHGVVGCANLSAVGMTRAEREACDDQLARGAKQAPVLEVVLQPRIRAYYDAVAKAKAPDRPPTPARAPGALGMFDVDDRGQTGHGPGFHCSFSFGSGPKPKLPAHWLKLGPSCAIVPPQGPLTVEADITPP
jgi:hypothetical protein